MPLPGWKARKIGRLHQASITCLRSLSGLILSGSADGNIRIFDTSLRCAAWFEVSSRVSFCFIVLAEETESFITHNPDLTLYLGLQAMAKHPSGFYQPSFASLFTNSIFMHSSRCWLEHPNLDQMQTSNAQQAVLYSERNARVNQLERGLDLHEY